MDSLAQPRKVMATSAPSTLSQGHFQLLHIDFGLLQDGQTHALPEGQEDHRLDGAELQNGFEGSQQVSRGKVEQIETI